MPWRPRKGTTPEGFELIEHTADVGVRARGRDLAGLFANAAAGMLEVVADTGALEAGDAVEVGLEVAAAGLEETMVAWLEELLYLSDVRGLLFSRVEVGEAAETAVAGTAWGVPVSSGRDAVRHEIKGVTYHRLEVRAGPAGGWTCQVLFDV
jgi:SHS2 domain-containing protein